MNVEKWCVRLFKASSDPVFSVMAAWQQQVLSGWDEVCGVLGVKMDACS